MPYDNLPESEWDKMDRCVEKVQGEGHDKEAAIAICYTSITGKSIKAGKRHSDSDQQHLDAALDHMMKAGAAIRTPEPVSDGTLPLPGTTAGVIAKWNGKEWKIIIDDAESDLPAMIVDVADIVSYGGEVKALGNGRVGGYLVRFGDEMKTDLTGDFFTAQTDFGDAQNSDAYYHHGLDAKLGKRVIGKGKLKRDDVGVWIEAQLEMRDEYEKAVYGMAEAGKLGWSSGTASHLIEREPAGKATWIKRWPLGLDASLTPTPAEPRNDVVPLKSLCGCDTPGQAASDDAQAAMQSDTKQTQQGEMTMTPEELAKLQADMAALKAQNEEMLTELRKPALNTAPPQAGHIQVNDTERPFKSLGEQLFAVRAAATGGATVQQGNRLDAVKAEAIKAIKATGANEEIGSDGGFLVQTEFATTLYERAYQSGAIVARCTRQPIGPGKNGVKLPAIDETSRADGSRWGGLRSYWASEGATATASRPAFRLINLELKKLLCLVYGTDELMEDATAFDAYLARTVPQEMAFKFEEGILRGPGGGQFVGILNAPATVSVTKETGQAAATIVYNNIVKMWSRMWAGGSGPNVVNGNGGSMGATVWLINQDILPQLAVMQLPVGTGGSAVFLPPGGASASPYGMLLGRPIIPVEQCSTLGTVGDIVLADLSQYILAEKGGVQAATSIHVQFLTAETAFRWTIRGDGQPLWNSALTPNQGSNTQSPFITLATRA